MKVSSPVGDYPYTIDSVRLEGARIVIAGHLGVWETTMQVEPGDWVALGRRAALPLAAAGTAGLALRARRRRSR